MRPPVPARALACRSPDLSHVPRLRSLCELRRVLSPPKRGARRSEARSGSKKSGEAVVASLSLFAFPVSRKIKRIWNGGRRRSLTSAPVTVRRRPLNGRGQLAFRRSTTALPKGCVVPWCDPGQVSWANRRKRRGSLRRRSAHFQRRTSHAGRNAGRHDAPDRPRAGCKPARGLRLSPHRRSLPPRQRPLRAR